MTEEGISSLVDTWIGVRDLEGIGGRNRGLSIFKSRGPTQGLAMTTETSEELHEEPLANGETWELRLYIAGQTPKSMTALANLRCYCEEHLANRYKLEVVDLLPSPQLAEGDQILAFPTLVRKVPVPIRKIIGDLSIQERVLVGADTRPLSSPNPH